jgi:uncharacterized RDD family membrane protein YckC
MTESPATGWYYALNGERVGPRSLDEVRSLVSTGVLHEDALVWTTGMRDWARVADVSVLSPVWAPPPLPTREDAPARPAEPEPAPRTAADTAPRPWHRLGARLVDMFLFLMGLSLLIALLAPEVVQRVSADPTRANPLLNLGGFLALIPIEGIVMHLFGNTPGKALFGIRVSTPDGGRLSFGQSIGRAARVMLLGLGAGLPFVSLIAPIFSFFRLRSRGITVWDEQMDLRVEHSSITTGSTVALGALLLFFVFLLSVAASGIAPG